MPELSVSWLLDIFTKESPGDQLILGLFLLLAGLVIVPFVAPQMIAVVTWMHGSLAEQAWHQAGMRLARYFFTFGSAYFAVLGTGYLVVYACAKSGLIGTPWK